MGLYHKDQVTTVKTNSFAARVYGWMTLGLTTTAVVALALAQSGLYQMLMPFWWIWTFGALGVGMAINRAITRCAPSTLTALFLVYAALEGMLFGTILPAFAAAYGGQVIWTAFAAAAGIFGMTALYGAFTKSDLTGLGQIMTFALLGLVLFTLLHLVLSFFLPLTGMHLLISYLGLVIFIGLTAYDAQNIKRASQQADNSEVAYKLSIMMALRMYINVVMIFWYLLQIFASSQRK